MLSPYIPLSPSHLLAAIMSTNDIYALLDKTVNWLFTFALVFAVIGILYGAFLFLNVGSDAQKFTTARWAVIGSVIGVAIAVLAKTILKVLESFLLRS